MMALVGGVPQDRSVARVLQQGMAPSCSLLVVARSGDGVESGSAVTASGAEDCQFEDGAMWPHRLEAEIDALLAEDTDKQLPESESLHVVSTQDKALHTVSSDPPLGIARGEELSGIAAEFEDLDFPRSASAKAEYVAELDARVRSTERAPSVGTGVGGAMVVKPTACDCGAGGATETRGHARGSLEQMGTSPVREVEGRLEGDSKRMTVVTVSSEAELRMAPLLALLNKKRMRFLRSGFSAIHDFGIEALIEIELRDFDFSGACRLLERMVGGRRKTATLAALRRWQCVASAVMTEAAISTAAETNAQPATQLSLVRKQERLSARSAFLSVPNHGAVGTTAEAEEKIRQEKHLLACYLLEEFAFSTEGMPSCATANLNTGIEDYYTVSPTSGISEAQPRERIFVHGCSQHPNDNSDTECQPREDAVAATDSETQLQLDIDRVLRELRTNVVESSTPTSRVSDVTPQVVTAPGRRGVQQRHQSQRQQRGRPRLQSNSLGKKGRPSEAEAAIKMVVDGIRVVTKEWCNEQITDVLAKILDFQTRCNASDTVEIAADPRGHPNIARATAETREAYGNSVIEAEVTEGDAGGEDGPAKRNREIQGIVGVFLSLKDGPRRQFVRWFTHLRLQVDKAAMVSDMVRAGDERVEQNACREVGGDGFSDFWDPFKVGKSGNMEADSKVGDERETDFDEEGEEGGNAEAEETGMGDVREGVRIEGWSRTPSSRFDLGAPGIKTSFAFATGASSSLDSTQAFSVGKVKARNTDAEISSTGKEVLVDGKESVSNEHERCGGIVPDQDPTGCLGAKSAAGKETVDLEARALSMSSSSEACILEAPHSAGVHSDEQVGLGGGQQAKPQKRKSGRTGKESRRRRAPAFMARKDAEREAAEREAAEREASERKAAEREAPSSAGVLKHQEKQEGGDDVGQRGDKKASLAFGAGASSSWGSIGMFSFGNSNVWGTQPELPWMGKGILFEGKECVDCERYGFGGIVPDQDETVCLGTENTDGNETFDFEARALSILNWSGACALGTPPTASAQVDERMVLGGRQQEKPQKRKSGRGGKGSKKRRDEAHWAKKDAERERLERERLEKESVGETQQQD